MEKGGGYDSILQDLKARKFAPVYFFCGEEAYQIDKLTQYIEDYLLNDMEKAFNQTVVYGKDVNARQIAETCGRLPMMAERQVVIVKEAQGLSLKDEEEKQLLAYVKNPVKTTVLVFAWKHGTPDGRKLFGKEVKKSAVYFESKPLYENQLAPWINAWLKERKHKIEESAAALLIEYVGSDLPKLSNELEKLILNKSAGTAITEDDIERLVGISKEFNVFELNTAVGTLNRAKAYRIVNYFIANPKNGPIELVLGTLQSFFTKLFVYHYNRNLPDKDLASVMKVSPYFVKDYHTAAKNFPLKKVEQAFYIIEEYDLRAKGVNNSGVERTELLRELVFKLMN
ncbi:MAG: DNA polymerase III subunit delta [Chitinophagales bacterium]|nr:DNA polymerase III subunit delta [Chitinophagales bacterium]